MIIKCITEIDYYYLKLLVLAVSISEDYIRGSFCILGGQCQLDYSLPFGRGFIESFLSVLIAPCQTSGLEPMHTFDFFFY